ncbi:transcription elongation factor GreA [candidate division WWE3 bacterium]|nr:transcription elongation factor GreA [candidate division WWE3 bacterium]
MVIEKQQIAITKTGFDMLKAEFEQLVHVDRPAIIRDIDEARQMGDLRENEAYHAARHKQALIQGRIDELEHILKNAMVVEQPDKTIGEVQLGSVVKLQISDGHKEFTIVGEHEVDITQNKISAASPLGQSLIGKRVGEIVQISVPAGSVEYRIVSIS